MLDEKLKEIFGYVNSWLSHAEAKNGALIALNGACILGIATLLLGKDNNISNLLRIYLIVTLVLLLLSTSVSLLSFLPMTGKLESSLDKDDPDSILLFFGDIAKFKNSRQYVLSIYKHYLNDLNKTENDISKSEDDYAREIIYNSKITVKKYNYFKISLFLTICAFISIPLYFSGYIIIEVYKKINKI
jgi:hypothetical protein